MNYDIDQLAKILPSWDLTTTSGSIQLSIKPLTIGDLASLNSASDLPGIIEPTQVDPTDSSKIIAPDISTLSVDSSMAILAAIGDYVRERAEKNSLALATKAREMRTAKNAASASS